MENIKIKNKEVELKFTFNSFKFMENFDIKAVEEIESKPFKIIPMLEVLLLGALNNNPKVKVSIVDVQEFIEGYIEDGSITELMEELMTLLQDSSFFKSLQKAKQK